jgi:GAF domain-containing protein
MAYVSIPWPKEKTALYKLLRQRLVALTDGVKHPVANLANASALLWDALPQINWVGFYLLEGDTLVLGPFQGKPACVEIATGKGVCGTAVAQDAVQLVPDVHAFPGHIACDGASRSEIVVPLHKDGKVAAVLDIDSPEPGRFDEADRDGLLALVSILEGLLP